MDSPAEFYMTDDTKMPRQIFAAFELDGTQYGMSLELSNFDRIYIMKFYRINNGKRRYWAFKKPAHIRRSLSTLLKFAEATLPFIKPRLDGIIVVIPGKYATQRFNRFTQLLIKKTYIKTFRYVPVVQDKQNSYNYLFFTKKTVNPKSLFKSKAFKSYNFEVDGALPVEAAEDVKEKKKPKASVSTKPSTKYQFKGYEVNNNDIDPALLDDLSKAKQVDEPKKKEDDELPSFSDEELVYVANPKVYDALIAKGGFDPKKFNVENLSWVIKQNFPKPILDDLIDKEYWDPNGLKLTTKGANAFKKAMQKISDNPKAVSIIGTLYKIQKVNDLSEKTDKKKEPAKEANIKPSDLPYDLPGSGEFVSDELLAPYGSFEIQEKIKEKRDYIYDKYCKANEAAFSEEEIFNVKDYTDYHYSDFNNPLREATIEFFEDTGKLNPQQRKRVQRKPNKLLVDSFAKAKPLEEGIWVYRGGYIRSKDIETFVPGSDYVDPAFVSTSLKSGNTFGMQNIKFVIYIPAGSRVIPALKDTWSTHPSEMEIILPPMAVQKVIKTQAIDNVIVAHTVFTGSAYDDIMSAMLAMNEEYVMTEAKKPTKKYDPNGKYGGTTTDSKTIEKIMKIVKSKKVKK